MLKEKKGVIIYCRVSTKDQVELTGSLEYQEKLCREYAQKNNLEIIKIFIEKGESAKTTDRTQLTKMLEFVPKNYRSIGAIVVHKLDRLARNVGDYTALVAGFTKLGIEVKSVTENFDDTPAGKLSKHMIAAIAEFDNSVRSERTALGMKQAIQNGRWCWRAPVGYSQTKDTVYKTLLVANKDAHFVVQAFDLFVTGLYTQIDIVKKLREKGFKRLTKGLLNRILHNPLYCALIKVSWYPDFIHAIHKPIISQETFYKAHFILTGKRLNIAPKVRNRPDFPLRNFIRCPVCGEKLTAGWSTGRKGMKYPYYHCRNGNCSVNARKEQIEALFYDYLKTLEPNRDTLALFEAIVREFWKNKQGECIKDTARIENDLRQLQARKDKIFELLVQCTIDETKYKQETQKIDDEIMIKRMALDECKTELNDIEPCLAYCRFVLLNVADLWRDGNLDLKQRFQSLVFPHQIVYDGGKFRTAETALIFKHLQTNSTTKSDLVAPTGFEPVFNG